MRRNYRIRYRLLVVAVALVCGVTADAARGRRASIDQSPGGAWENETSYTSMTSIDSENYGFNAGPIELPTASHLDDFDTSLPSFEMAPMQLKIGTKVYRHVWVNRNGFISLVENENGLPPAFSPGLATLSAVGGNVIAPFYSAIDLRLDDTCGNEPRTCIRDMTYSTLDLGEALDREDGSVDYALGFRATWGLFPTSYDDPDDTAGNALRPPGVTRAGSAETSARNTFQIWLIDRQLSPGAHPGDFDIQLNYSGVKWQEATTHVGVKIGPANSPDVLLDFAKFYTSFLDNSPDISAANVNDCTAQSFPLVPPPFDKAYALGCNWITVEFRDGKPNLKGYTSDLSGTIAANAGTPHSTVPYGMTLSISNGDFNAATNVTARVDLPAGATLTSTPPAAPCVQTGAVAVCSLSGSLAPHTSVSVPVLVTSTQTGLQNFRLRVDANQYDQDTSGNDKSTSVTVADSADLSITACTRTASVVQGTAATVTCTVKNNGPQAAADVVIEATVPSVLTFTSGTGCAVTAGALACTGAALASGASRDVAVTFNTSAAGTAALLVAARSPTTFDPVANAATDASFVVTSQPVTPPPPPPPPPPPKKKSGGLSLEELFVLLLGVALVARRRYEHTRSRWATG